MYYQYPTPEGVEIQYRYVQNDSTTSVLSVLLAAAQLLRIVCTCILARDILNYKIANLATHESVHSAMLPLTPHLYNTLFQDQLGL